jgi:hypothetical protein
MMRHLGVIFVVMAYEFFHACLTDWAQSPVPFYQVFSDIVPFFAGKKKDCQRRLVSSCPLQYKGSDLWGTLV